MPDIGTPRCSVRLPQYREGVSGVLCAHVCLSARLFPCAWRTLLRLLYCGVGSSAAVCSTSLDTVTASVLFLPVRTTSTGTVFPTGVAETKAGRAAEPPIF